MSAPDAWHVTKALGAGSNEEQEMRSMASLRSGTDHPLLPDPLASGTVTSLTK